MSTSTMELLPPTQASASICSRGDGRGEPGSTLEDVILGTWEDLAAHGRADCPVCRGPLEHLGCGSCGSTLS